MQTWQSSMYLQGKTIFSPSKRVMTMLSPSLIVKSVWYSLSMKRITRWSLLGFGKAITPMILTGSRSVIRFHLYRSKK